MKKKSLILALFLLFASLFFANVVSATESATVTKELVGNWSILTLDTLSFLIVVNNTGTTNGSFDVIDIFNASTLSYSHANPLPNSNWTNNLTWQVFLEPNESQNISVNFTGVGITESAGNLNVVSVYNSSGTELINSSALYNISAHSFNFTGTKSLLSTGPKYVSDTIEYLLNVTNLNDTYAETNITIRDIYDSSTLKYNTSNPSPSSINTTSGIIEWNISFSASENVPIYINFTANQSGQDIQNNLSVLNSSLDEIVGDSVDINISATPVRNITVTKEISGNTSSFTVNDSLSFLLTINNSGTTNESLNVTDMFNSSNIAYLSSNVTPSQTSSTHISWNLSLDANESTQILVTFNATAPTGGITYNNISIQNTTGSELATTSQNYSISAGTQHIQNVSIEASLSNLGPYYVNGTIRYLLNITNLNESVTEENLTIQTRFDPSYLTAPSSDTTPTTQSTGLIEWKINLSPGQNYFITVNFTANQSATNLQSNVSILNQSLSELANDSIAVNISIYSPPHQQNISVVSSLLNAAPYYVGDTLQYKINITNLNDSVAEENLTIRNTYEEEKFIYSSTSFNPSFLNESGGIVEWQVNLSASQSSVFYINFTANQTGSVQNYLSIVNSSEVEIGNESSNVTINTTQKVNLSLDLTRSSQEIPFVGKEVTFTLFLNNSGNKDATNMTLQLSFNETILNFSPSTSSLTAYNTSNGTLEWNVNVSQNSTSSTTLSFTSLANVSLSNVSIWLFNESHNLLKYDSQTYSVQSLPDILVSKSYLSSGTKYVGNSLQFLITLNNTNPSVNYSNVTLRDSFSSSLSFTSANVTPKNSTSTSLEWTFNLSANSSKEILLTFTAASVVSNAETTVFIENESNSSIYNVSASYSISAVQSTSSGGGGGGGGGSSSKKKESTTTTQEETKTETVSTTPKEEVPPPVSEEEKQEEEKIKQTAIESLQLNDSTIKTIQIKEEEILEEKENNISQEDLEKLKVENPAAENILQKARESGSNIKSTSKAKVRVVEIVTEDNQTKNVTAIKKEITISLNENSSEFIKVIEVIPKEVAISAKESIRGNFSVLVDDPVIEFTIPKEEILNGVATIEYSVIGNVAKESSAILTEVVNSELETYIEESKSPKVEGEAKSIQTSFKSDNKLYLVIIITLAILVGVGVFFALQKEEYFGSENERSPHQTDERKKKNSESALKEAVKGKENTPVEGIELFKKKSSPKNYSHSGLTEREKRAKEQIKHLLNRKEK